MIKELIFLGCILNAIYIGYVDGNPVGKCPIINSSPDTFLPDDTNCHSFYQCSWGVAYRMECYGDLIFDHKLQICNYPTQTECYSVADGSNSRENPGAESENSESGGEIFEENDDSGESWNEACTDDILQSYFPDPQNCKAFFICNAGVLHHIVCPDDTVYNPTYRICDYSKSVTCSETPAVVNPEPVNPGNDGEDGGEDSGESWQSSCTIGSTQIYYPDPEDCQGFYMCEFGTLKHLSCPVGTLYNAALLICDHPGNVRCSQEPEVVNPEPVNPGDGGDGGGSGDGENSGEGGGESWSDPCSLNSKQIYFPDPEDCQGFYICNFGKLQHMMCPPGTLYNAPILTCDYPGNVRCSMSPIGVGPEQVN